MPAKGNLMTQKKKAPSDFDSFIESYVLDKMQQRGGAALTSEDLSDFIKKCGQKFLESTLKGELDYHLKNNVLDVNKAQESNSDQDKLPPNKRNGTTKKTVITDLGEIDLNVPRDRNSTFEPISVPKRERRIKGIDDKIISMYARGMSTREISSHLEELYGVGVSAEFISHVTESVLEDVKEWQNRPLDACYPVVFFDALRVKIRSGAGVKAMAVHLALGIKTDGSRDVLGMWFNENEGASFWASVFTELKNRGVEDILIAVTDGLKGMTEALNTVFPETLHQTCIVHLIRNSVAFISWKDIKGVTHALKMIYQAPTAEAAKEELEQFKQSAYGKRYPNIAAIWERAWGQVVPFYNFGPEVRRLIYTTNCIEALNRLIRKVIKTRTLFPNEDAAKKLIWLAIKNSTKEWNKTVFKWRHALLEMKLVFGDRLRLE